MRRPAVLLLLALAIALVPTAAGATTVTVHDDAEYRQALVDLSADESGPHTIVFEGDIDFEDGGVLGYGANQDLRLLGNGHVLTGAVGDVIEGGRLRTLRVDDLTIRGTTGGIDWRGPVVVHDSNFERIGRGRELARVHPAIEATRVDLVDSRIVGNRGGGWPIIDAGELYGTRVTITANDAPLPIVRGGHVLQLRESLVARNLHRNSSLLHLHGRGRIELIDTRVVGNRSMFRHRNGTIDAWQKVVLVRTTIRGNHPTGPDQPAIQADALVARGSTIRHPTHDCNVRHTFASGSTASDPSCRF